jgi:hypothetical protein
MMSRRFLGMVGVLLAAVALTTIVFGAYQVGLAQGDGATEGVRHHGPWGPYGGGFGFGFIFIKLLFAFLVFGLIFGVLRAAFGGPRWSGPWGGERWASGRGPRATFEEWHRRAHEGAAPTQGSDAEGSAGGTNAS